jgi:hypothetical protein
MALTDLLFFSPSREPLILPRTGDRDLRSMKRIRERATVGDKAADVRTPEQPSQARSSNRQTRQELLAPNRRR